MRDVKILQLPAGPFQVFSYLAACPETGEGVIIDPADPGDDLFAAVRRESVNIKYILNTHGHADHVLGNRAFKEAFGAPVCMHAADDDFFSDPEIRKQTEKELGLPGPEPADIRLADGDVLHAGRLEIRVIHTPGHTPGSVCFYICGNLFTGDTLFVESAGRMDLAGGSLDALIASLETKVLPLPEDTIIRPGHDYGSTPVSTLKHEMAENPYITDFILS